MSSAFNKKTDSVFTFDNDVVIWIENVMFFVINHFGDHAVIMGFYSQWGKLNFDPRAISQKYTYLYIFL